MMDLLYNSSISTLDIHTTTIIYMRKWSYCDIPKNSSIQLQDVRRFHNRN